MLKHHLVTAVNWSWDALHGVETRQHVPVAVGHAYEPIGLHHLRALLRHAATILPISQTTLVDVGSGKGRPVLYAARAPYRAVIGVEYDPALHARALHNLQRYRGPRRAPVQFVCADARTYDWPTGPLAVLFFNPFPESIMADVIARVPRHTLALCAGEYTCRQPFERAGWRTVFHEGQRTMHHFS